MRELVESIRQIQLQQKKALRESKMSEIDLEIGELRDEGMSDEEIVNQLVAQYDLPREFAAQMVAEKEGGFEEAVSDSDKETMNIHAKQARPEVERTKAVSRQYGGEKAAKNVEHGFRSAFKRKYKKLDSVEETRFATSGGNYKTGTYHVVVDGKAVSSHPNKAIATVARDKIVKQSPELHARARVKHESEILESQDEASKAGFTAGFSGKPRQNPYEKNTKDYLRWDQEYQMGAEDRAYEKNGFRPSRPMPKVTRESTLAEDGKEYGIKQIDGEWCVVDATGNIVDTATDKLGAMQAARDLNKIKPTNKRTIQGTRPADVEEDFTPGQYGSTLEEIIRSIAKKYLNTDLDSDSSIGDGSVGSLNAALGDAFVAGYHKGQQRAGVKPVQESSEDYYAQNAKRLEQAAEQVRVFLYDEPRISSYERKQLESDLANAEEYFDIADPDDVAKAEKYLSAVEAFFMGLDD